MAGVAAGAAHALATPLSTLSILLDELEERGSEVGDVRLAKDRLRVVRERLDEVLRKSGRGHAVSGPEDFGELLNRTIRHWHERRPECDLRVEQRVPSMVTAVDPAVGHGLVTLLDNAADANVEAGTTRVSLRVGVAEGCLHLEVEDEGGGSPSMNATLGGTTKTYGHGVELMILRTNLERLGGVLGFTTGRKGSIAHLALPLDGTSA